MSLQDIEIKAEYRSLLDQVAKDFFVPLLSQAISYKRAVGFFSSSALVEISKGVIALVENGGKIELIASPYLSEEDIKSIREGYELRDDVVKRAIRKELRDVQSAKEESRLNLLSYLIAEGRLDIKIALTKNENELGMYHEKMGLIEDAEGNVVAFSGSMNESRTAFLVNYESIDVFCSWKGDDERVRAKSQAFTAIWNNFEQNIEIIDFPELKQEIIEKYKRNSPDFKIDKTDFGSLTSGNIDQWIKLPDWLCLYDYQKGAISNWQEHDFRGIFDMATGSGKTLTALGGLERLCKITKSNLGVVIVCPYQHLIEQWVEDIRQFNIEPLICYSAYNWKKKFKNTISDYRFGVIKNFCVITTNDTLATEYFQKEIDKLKGNICLVVDEAHNFGARRQLECMKEVYKYRLALSATLERHHDEDGTNRLKEFFGEKCVEYSLEQAIKDDKLTPYYYYPVPVYLESDELDEYNELTEKIINIIRKSPKNAPLPQSAEMLLIKRARVVAAARNKISALYKIIKNDYTNDNQMLIYCGATTVENSCYIEGKVNTDEKRQIEIVIEMLGKELGMRVSKFTSEENSKEREDIKEFFKNGDMLQALVAIRCLDEGMNIPGIRTAFILASSTNPKEYIQRRGRVLRKAPNKSYAKIYDFITLPRDLDYPVNSSTHLNSEYSLIRREYERMEDFARLSENPSEVIKLQDKITEFYNLYYSGGQDYGI